MRGVSQSRNFAGIRGGKKKRSVIEKAIALQQDFHFS